MLSKLWRTHATAGVVGLLAFAYAIVVVHEPLAGLFAGGTIAFGVLLLSDLADRGYPTVLGRRGTLAVIVGTIAFLGVKLVFGRPFSGFITVLLLAPTFAIVVWGIARLSHRGYPESMGRRRSLTTGLVVCSLVAYGAFSGAVGFLVGISSGVLVGLASWLTSPRGPLRS